MADAIFFLGHRDVPIDEEQKKELLAFVRDDGKGFVAAHTALTAFDSWPEFGELHRRPLRRTSVARAGHGDQRGRRFPGDARISRRPSRSTTSSIRRRSSRRTRGSCCGSTSRRCRRTRNCGKEGFPLAWAKNYGKGRVFYSSFGHDAAHVGQPRRRADVFRGDQVGARPHAKATPRRARRARSAQ